MNIFEDTTPCVTPPSVHIDIKSIPAAAIRLAPVPHVPTDEDLADMFPDIAPDKRPLRMAEERHWLNPSEEQNYVEHYSLRLPFPERSIVFGTNGVISVAIQCVDEAPLAAYKRELIDKYECVGFHANIKYTISNLRTIHQFQNMFAWLKDIYLVDESLRGPINLSKVALLQQAIDILEPTACMGWFKTLKDKDDRKLISVLAPQLSQRLKNPTALEPTPVDAKSLPRPGNALARVRFDKIEYIESPSRTVEPLTEPRSFRILICKTPMSGTIGKHVMWKDANLPILVKPDSIPSIAFNDTHMAVTYQSPDFAEDILSVSLYSIVLEGKRYFNHVHTVHFKGRFADGFLTTQLSEKNQVCIALGSGVTIVDLSGVGTAEYVYLEPENPKHRRKVTFASMKEDELLVATNKGEYYRIDLKKSTVVETNQILAVEPIYDVQYNYGQLYMQSTMSVSGQFRPQHAGYDVLDLNRPTCMATRGCLLFVATKYGHIQVFTRIKEGIVRTFNPIQQQQQAMNQQPIVPNGIKAYDDYIVCVNQNGVVRYVGLKKEGKI